MVTTPSKLSVIIPVGPDEKEPGRLAGDLLLLPDGSEILFVLCQPVASFGPRPCLEALLAQRYQLHWLTSPRGRAVQQNTGARHASGDWFWFLHWDSGFGADLLADLRRGVERRPDHLHFARLAFMRDGPSLMGLNALGANVRSRWLGIPFGDQGFFLHRSLFVRLGGFDERAPYGEDHLLVWRAHRLGVGLHATGSYVWTSARKYRQQGQLKLTLCYQWLWLKQALPQLILRLLGR